MVKKIILTLFFSIFICVFVGFNYLLIQKESSDIDVSDLNEKLDRNDVTISSQADSIIEHERKSIELNEQIAFLREQGEEKDDSIESLEKEVQDRDELLGIKEDLINKLKQGLDVEQVGQQAREWIEFINNGDYEKSYARFNKAVDNAYTTMILSEFRAYYERQVGMIDIKSIDVMTRGIPENIDNDLVIAVVVDIVTPRSLELFYESLDKQREIAEALAEAEARAEAARRAAEEADELLAQMLAAAAAEDEPDDGDDIDGDAESSAGGNGLQDGAATQGVINGDNGSNTNNRGAEDDMNSDVNDSANADINGEVNGDANGLVNGPSNNEANNSAGLGADNAGAGDGAAASGLESDGRPAQNGATDDNNGGTGGNGGETGANGANGVNGVNGANGEGAVSVENGENGEMTGSGVDSTGGNITGDDDPSGGGDPSGEGGTAEDGEPVEDDFDPFDRDTYITAGAVLAAMAEYEYIYIDDLDDSVFNTGENQFFFLLNYKKEANDWEIIRIVQKL